MKTAASQVAPSPIDHLNALTTALDHARTMVISTADMRMRNFNFYVLVTGALIAGCAQPLMKGWLTAFYAAGIVSTILFVGLDIRGYSLHRRSVDQMQLLEERIWEGAGIRHLWTPIPRDGGFKFIKHNWIYRTFFVLTGGAWITALIARQI